MHPYGFDEITFKMARESIFQQFKFNLCKLHGMSYDDAKLESYDQCWNSLTAYEKGVVYKTALGDGHWPSLRKMGEDLHLLHGLTTISGFSDHLQIVNFPPQVLAAFKDPKSIKLLWGRRIQQAIYKGRDAVIFKANTIVQRRGAGEKLKDAAVYKELIASVLQVSHTEFD